MADKIVSQDPTQPGVLKVNGPALTAANQIPLNGLDATGAANGNVVMLSGGVWTPQGTTSINTASNLGAGAQVFSSKVSNDFQFRTLVQGNDITITQAGNAVTIASNVGDYVCALDLKTQNTSGGTFTSGAWQTRDLQTIQADNNGQATIGASSIILNQGSWIVWASCPAFSVGSHQARLFNVDTGLTILTGTSMNAPAAGGVCNSSIICGQITVVSAAEEIQLQHQCSSTFATSGFGLAANFASEIYSIITFTKNVF